MEKESFAAVLTALQTATASAANRTVKSCEDLFRTHKSNLSLFGDMLTDAFDRVLSAPLSSNIDRTLDTLCRITTLRTDLVHSVLQHLASRMDCKDRVLRLRALVAAGSILEAWRGEEGGGGLQRTLWTLLSSALLPRLRDRAAGVRNAAVRAAAWLQDTDSAEGGDSGGGGDEGAGRDAGDGAVHKALLWAMAFDPSKEVRRAAVAAIAVTANSIRAIVERARDASPTVRAATYSKLASQVHVNMLSREQVNCLLSTGLTDAADVVRKQVVNMIASWMWELGLPFDVLKLLDIIGVADNQHVATLTLFALFSFTEGPKPTGPAVSGVSKLVRTSTALDAVEEGDENDASDEADSVVCELPTGVTPLALWTYTKEMVETTAPTLDDIDVESMFYLRARLSWLSGELCCQTGCKLSADDKDIQIEKLMPATVAWADLLANVAHACGIFVDNDLLTKMMSRREIAGDMVRASIACIPAHSSLASVRKLPLEDATAVQMLTQTLACADYLDFADEAGKVRALSCLCQLIAHPMLPVSLISAVSKGVWSVLGAASPNGSEASAQAFASIMGNACARLQAASCICTTGKVGDDETGSHVEKLRQAAEHLRQQFEDAMDADDDSLAACIKKKLEEVEAALEGVEDGDESAAVETHHDGRAVKPAELGQLYWLRMLHVYDASFFRMSKALNSGVPRQFVHTVTEVCSQIEHQSGVSLLMGPPTGTSALCILQAVCAPSMMSESPEVSTLGFRVAVQFTMLQIDDVAARTLWSEKLPWLRTNLLTLETACKNVEKVGFICDLLCWHSDLACDITDSVVPLLTASNMSEPQMYGALVATAVKGATRAAISGSLAARPNLLRALLTQFFECYITSTAICATVGLPDESAVCHIGDIYTALNAFFPCFSSQCPANLQLVISAAIENAGPLLARCRSLASTGAQYSSSITALSQSDGVGKSGEEPDLDSVEGDGLKLPSDSSAAAAFFAHFWTLVGALSTTDSFLLAEPAFAFDGDEVLAPFATTAGLSASDVDSTSPPSTTAVLPLAVSAHVLAWLCAFAQNNDYLSFSLISSLLPSLLPSAGPSSPLRSSPLLAYLRGQLLQSLDLLDTTATARKALAKQVLSTLSAVFGTGNAAVDADIDVNIAKFADKILQETVSNVLLEAVAPTASTKTTRARRTTKK